MGVFTKIWAGVWSARMEYILGNTVRALLESPGNSILGITRMYIDKQYRKRIVDNIKDPMVRVFWTDEYANYDQKFVKDAVAPIQNKVGQFLSSAIIRNIVGQPKSTIDLREIMDNRKILLMDLSKGKVGEENAALLGAMIITKLQLAAMSRVDMREEDRPDFYLYVDEFQNFATESFATILSEARKYHLNLIMGHQYIGQLTPTKDNSRLRDAIFGNVGSMVCFRVGAADAEFLETEFAPVYTPNDLVNLPKYHILLKLMINGVSSEPFSARSIPVNPDFRTGNAEKVVRVSRERYGNPVEQVEERISRWMGAEFHQKSAAMAGDEKEVNDVSMLLAPERSAPSPARPVERNDAPQNLVEMQKQVVPDAPVTLSTEMVVGAPRASEPLVYKAPPIPTPAKSEYEPPRQRSAPSTMSRPAPVQKFAAARPTERPFNNLRPRNRDAGFEKPSGPRKQQPSAPKAAGSAKPNIWDTVAQMHQERDLDIVEKLSSALVVDAAPVQPSKQAQQNAGNNALHQAAEQQKEVHKKVMRPGEKHTF